MLAFRWICCSALSVFFAIVSTAIASADTYRCYVEHKWSCDTEGCQEKPDNGAYFVFNFDEKKYLNCEKGTAGGCIELPLSNGKSSRDFYAVQLAPLSQLRIFYPYGGEHRTLFMVVIDTAHFISTRSGHCDVVKVRIPNIE
ncbi:hypothetical protein IWQ48_004229 [Labrenzia sp. EL_13]|nr:hypothetical protein [Labrenzia sp. EL_13]